MSDTSTVSGSEAGSSMAPGASPATSSGAPAPESHSRSLNYGSMPEPTKPEAPAFKVPEKYADAQWAKGIDSYDKLFDQFANAQSLIGKKTIGIPGPDASDQEWNDYFSKVRPEKYEMPKRDLPEELTKDRKPDEKLFNTFHELGLTQRQVDGIFKYYDGVVKQNYEAQKNQRAQIDAQFDELATKTWGAETDSVIARSGELLAKYAPESMREHLNKLDNNSAILLAGVINNMAQAYAAEDGSGGKGAAVSAESYDSLMAKATEIRNNPALLDQFHPQYESLKTQLTDIYRKAERLKSR